MLFKYCPSRSTGQLLVDQFRIMGYVLLALNWVLTYMGHLLPAPNEPRMTIFKFGLSLSFFAPTCSVGFLLQFCVTFTALCWCGFNQFIEEVDSVHWK